MANSWEICRLTVSTTKTSRPDAPCCISCVLELHHLEGERVNIPVRACLTLLTIHEIGKIDQILSSRSIVISQDLIVDERQTEGVGNDNDHAEGLLAVWWFGNICPSSIH